MSPESLLAPLDMVRGRVLGAVARAGGRRLLSDRGLRVSVTGVFAVAAAFVATCVAPLWLMATTPLLLGIPHVVSEVRYLVVQPRLHRRLVPAALVTALLAVGSFLPRTAFRLAPALVTIGAAGSWTRRTTAAAVFWVLLVVVTFRWERLATALLAHAHNLLALGIWVAWAARRRTTAIATLIAFAAASVALLSGAAEWALARTGARFAARADMDLPTLLHVLAPGAPPPLGLRLVLFFVFAQSVHYAIWLRVVPDERRPRPGVRSFASSYRALVADFGAPILWTVSLGVAGLLAYACLHLAAARSLYFELVAFHGGLEIALALGWIAGGKAPQASLA